MNETKNTATVSKNWRLRTRRKDYTWLRNTDIDSRLYDTFVCLLQRSCCRHSSAMLNSAVKGLVRVQGENKQRAKREIGTKIKWIKKGKRVSGAELLDGSSCLSSNRVPSHTRTDSSSLPLQDYVSSCSLLTSRHVTARPIQHWLRGICSDCVCLTHNTHMNTRLCW